MKPIEQWEENDLNFLIANKLSENIEREYKETISIGKPLERKELCKDVSAMANSQGGVIIFGLKETKRENMGSVPEALSPIIDHSLKEVAQQVILDGVKPRMEFRFYSTPASEGNGEYVFIEIHKSLRGLHMVTLDGKNRYYIRRDFQCVPMTPFEIEEAYRQYALQNVDAERKIIKYKLGNPNENMKSPSSAWLSVTTVPIFPVLDLFVPLCSLPRYEIPDKAKGMRTRNGVPGADKFSPNYYGMRSEETRDGAVLYQHQIFREGAIHIGHKLNFIRSEQKIFLLSLIEELHNLLALSVGLFHDAGYLGPIKILIEIDQITNFILEIEKSNRRNEIKFSERSFSHVLTTTVRSVIDSIPAVIEPMQHHLCQSFGHSRCQLYDPQNGVYVDRVTQVIRFIEN